MKKKVEIEDDDRRKQEITKAVAQAWYARSGSSKPSNEFDAHRRNFGGKPSRFKLEARNKSPANASSNARWDFAQSLWDSYEIVSVAKRLETGLVLENTLARVGDEDDENTSRVHRRRKESKNSLRNLFNRLSSRRFNETDVPG